MSNDVRPDAAISRRHLLKMASVAGAGALAGGGIPGTLHAEEASPLPADATPDQALQTLMVGNQRFLGGKATSPNRTLARLKEVGPKQTPFASVLACADSRVPVELVFDQGIGDVFVCRNAGNIAESQTIGSLEYGTLVLGAKVLMVLGHTSCGAVTATVKGEAVPGQIGSLYPYIYPAVEQAGSKDLTAIITQNVRHQVGILRNASPVIKQLVADRKLRVVGAVLDFSTGRVNLLDA